MNNRLLISTLAFLFLLKGISQVSAPTVEEILHNIQSEQAMNDDFYDDGLLPSQRYWFSKNKGLEDNNFFFTAGAVFTLNTLKGRINETDLIEEISSKAMANYLNYANRHGKPGLYNFWKTAHPDLPFPNGIKLMNREKYRMPDDYDDTSLIQMAKPDTSGSMAVRRQMLKYAQRANRSNMKSIMKPYKQIRAYEVWFADKVDPEFDISVMCNVMTFVFKNGFDLTETDHETIRLLKTVLKREDHIQKPKKVSKYYRTVPLVLYHLARMMSYDKGNIFIDQREGLKADIKQELKHASSEMDKIILYSSLARLGEPLTPEVNWQKVYEETKTFCWFFFKPKGVFFFLPKMAWKSEAYNWTLVLECLTLTQTSN